MMKSWKSLLLGLMLALSVDAYAVGRLTRTINSAWIFSQDGKETLVNIPHTWNALDIQDETPGYWRGLCTYRKNLHISDDLSGKKVFIRFEGVNQETELIVNGTSVGTHVGGYSAFCFDVTPYVRQGKNDILVKVDNKHNVEIPPLSADFSFLGGIYRDVELIITADAHISLTHYGSSGVYITTPEVSESVSRLNFQTYVGASVKDRYVLEQELIDACSRIIASVSDKIIIEEGDNQLFTQSLEVRNVNLWDVDSPYLYRVRTFLKDRNGNVIDQVENPVGFRTYAIDKDKGFFLNGRNLKLTGTNRHQDYHKKGNALSDEMHVRDINLLKDMGGNFLRISHYPQDPIVVQMCDRLGLLASVEIPVVDMVTQDCPEFNSNTVNMLKEMIYQHINNPSIIIWCYGNEYQHKAPFDSWFATEEQICGHFRSEAGLFEECQKVCKTIDSARPTMAVICADPIEVYSLSKAGHIPDIMGFNIYSGWYGGEFSKMKDHLHHLREVFPDQPILLTEYGAGVDPRIHSNKPTRFDYSSEYGRMFHSEYLKMFKEMPWLMGTAVWNLNDFYSEWRIDAVPHVNNKGLVGLDREKKNGYFLYQAYLSKKPYLMIGDRKWEIRGGLEGETHKIEVFSNAENVSLSINGKSFGTKAVEDCLAIFEVVYFPGENYIAVEDSNGLKDAIKVEYRQVPDDMNDFTEMNIMLATDRVFEDRQAGAVWIPEKEYAPGSWGYIGGDRFIDGENPRSFSSLKIYGTDNDPIFQTQRVGIEGFKADVPDGQYYVYLYFTELFIKPDGTPIMYKIGETEIQETERVFDVSINGEVVLKDFDMKKQFGSQRSIIKKFTVNVNDGEGIMVGFDAIKGYPVLNAVRIYKCR